MQKWLAVILAIFFASSSYAQRTPVDRAQIWLDRELTKPMPFPELDGMRVEMEQVDAQKPDPAALASLRIAVGRNKAHPDVTKLGLMEAAAKGQPATTRYRMWWRGDSECRISMDSDATADGRYLDSVTTDEVEWSLSPILCQVVRGGTGEATAYNTKTRRDNNRQTLLVLRYGLIAELRLLLERVPDVSRPKVISVSPTLRIACEKPDGSMKITCEGEWVEAGEPLGLTRMIVEWADESGPRVTRREVSSRGPVEGLSTPVWTLYHRNLGEGWNDRFKLLRVAADPTPFERLVSPPAFDSQDAIRGGVVSPSILDRRSGREIILTNRNGVILETPGTELPSRRADQLLRYVGWLTPPLVAAAVLGIVLWRRRQG
ncbi:MAG: hypothetical protein HEQ23_08445 [Tepidisphaera sp.]